MHACEMEGYAGMTQVVPETFSERSMHEGVSHHSFDEIDTFQATSPPAISTQAVQRLDDRPASRCRDGSQQQIRLQYKLKQACCARNATMNLLTSKRESVKILSSGRLARAMNRLVHRRRRPSRCALRVEDLRSVCSNGLFDSFHMPCNTPTSGVPTIRNLAKVVPLVSDTILSGTDSNSSVLF